MVFYKNKSLIWAKYRHEISLHVTEHLFHLLLEIETTNLNFQDDH